MLLHHSPDMGGAFAREVLAFRELPAGMAAEEGRLWMVMAPSDAARPRREAYTVTVARHPATGVHQYQPMGRLDILPSLPGEGEFRGMAVQGARVLAMDSEGCVVVLAATGWGAVAGAPRGIALVPWGNTVAVLLPTDPVEAWVLSNDMTPGSVGLAGVEGAVVRGIGGAATPHLLVGRPTGDWEIVQVAQGEVRVAATIPPEARNWAVVALGSTLLLLEAAPDGGILTRTLEADTAEFAPGERWTAPPSQAGQWILLVLAALFAGLLLAGGILVLSPWRAPREAAPYGFSPMPPLRRAAALAVDLVPGVAVALALGYPWRALLQSPFSSSTGEGALPGLVVIGVAVALSGATELVTGTSLGKWLMGGRVARLAPAGERPGVWQVLVRNIFKALVLVVPLALVFTVWAPGFRGIAEVCSRTGVVRTTRPGPESGHPLKGAPSDRR